MSLHKLSAGSGYEYLTRQVAALDSTGKGATPLADYYSAKGESPGRWVGSGLAGIDGLEADDVVTAEQMKLLFGAGQDPVSGVALGRRNAVYRKDGVDGFDAEVARRMEATPHRAAAEIRSEVGREFFVRRHSRAPRDARELASAVARFSRPQQSAVSGLPQIGNGQIVMGHGELRVKLNRLFGCGQGLGKVACHDLRRGKVHPRKGQFGIVMGGLGV